MVKQLKRAMCRFTLAAALVFITLAGPAAADLEPARLEKTVVTASRTDANLSTVPASVEVVTEEEIKARSANRIRDILKLSIGVNLQQKEPVIRGFKGEHSIVMVDGKRVAGEVSHSFELDRITTENIERIEIVRGPMSAVYGSDALGGIINIITKKPNKFSFKSQAQYGQFDNDGQNKDLSFHLMSGGHEMGPWGVSLSGQIFDAEPYIQENGDTPRPDRNLKTGALKLTYDFDKDTTLTFDASVMDEEEESIITSTMGPSQIQNKIYDDNHRYDLSLGLSHKQQGTEAFFKIYTSVYDKYSETRYNKDATLKGKLVKEGDLSNFGKVDRWTRIAEGRISKVFFDDHFLTFGGEYRYEYFKGPWIKTGEGTYQVTKEGMTKTGSEAKIKYYAGYIQDEWQITDRFLIVPALRYDCSDELENQLSPKIGATFCLLPNLRIKANYGQGFKNPTPAELYLNAYRFGKHILGDPDLDSEKSKSYEAAIEGELGRFTYRTAYFYNDVKDLITKKMVKPKKDLHFTNINKAEIQGIELEAGFDLMENFSIKGSYVYLDAKDKKTGERLEARPRNRAILNTSYDNNDHGFRADFWLEYTDGYLIEPEKEESYTLCHLGLAKDLTKNLEIYVNVDNIFDKKVE
ncbi:MAG: TonB-dependent receptor, partial [Desulfobacterales bacterium]|nr:TonB-dependent receptor [Desulfobacterales bacterium]